MKLQITYLPTEQLTPYKNNAKLHPQEQIDEIKASINEFGMNDPIGICGIDNIIVEGHGRLIACQQLGIENVPVVRLDHLTEEQRRAYTLVHNKLTMNTGFDLEMLKTELEDINLDMGEFGFSVELDEIDLHEKDEIVEDEVPEPPAEPVAKYGDIYNLGDHVLMCGDATKEEDVQKLLHQKTFDLFITDPPYNVDYEGGTAEKLKIKNDNMEFAEFQEFLYKSFTNAFNALKAGAAFYVWYASREVVNFTTALLRAGLEPRQELIWNKNALVLGRQDYQWKHEPCLYGWKPRRSSLFCKRSEFNHCHGL